MTMNQPRTHDLPLSVCMAFRILATGFPLLSDMPTNFIGNDRTSFVSNMIIYSSQSLSTFLDTEFFQLLSNRNCMDMGTTGQYWLKNTLFLHIPIYHWHLPLGCVLMYFCSHGL